LAISYYLLMTVVSSATGSSKEMQYNYNLLTEIVCWLHTWIKHARIPVSQTVSDSNFRKV